jgi:hypothetical protein
VIVLLVLVRSICSFRSQTERSHRGSEDPTPESPACPRYLLRSIWERGHRPDVSLNQALLQRNRRGGQRPDPICSCSRRWLHLIALRRNPPPRRCSTDPIQFGKKKVTGIWIAPPQRLSAPGRPRAALFSALAIEDSGRSWTPCISPPIETRAPCQVGRPICTGGGCSSTPGGDRPGIARPQTVSVLQRHEELAFISFVSCRSLLSKEEKSSCGIDCLRSVLGTASLFSAVIVCCTWIVQLWRRKMFYLIGFRFNLDMFLLPLAINKAFGGYCMCTLKAKVLGNNFQNVS